MLKWLPIEMSKLDRGLFLCVSIASVNFHRNPCSFLEEEVGNVKSLQTIDNKQ